MSATTAKKPGKEKVFRDAVHGYIRVPDEYCRDFVDTDLFQRLRHIEQTSMRVLYPCAHHDRFAHSMGVFHLGGMAFHYLRRNSADNVKLDIKTWDRLKATFRIACLLHDCGHAPFSHTFEKYYDLKSRLDPVLMRKMHGAAFRQDYEHCSPNPHEKASAIILLARYAPAIKKHGADPKLAARMIIGCLHRGPKNIQEKIENCLIQLLNGKAFDVDKLDYTARDTWASGVNNSSIDIQRALAALRVRKHEDRYVLAFGKSALSVIQSLLDGRNFLFQWIYAHHKVRYDQYLLKKAVEGVAKQIKKSDSDSVLRDIFSIDIFDKPQKIGKFVLYQPTDGDLIHMMKCYRDKIPEADEWLSRHHSRKALWKTEAEYHAHFSTLDDDQRGTIQKRCEKHFKDFAQKKSIEGGFVILDEPPKLVSVKKNEIFVILDETPVSYTETGLHHIPHVRLKDCFFVYAPKKIASQRKQLIDGLKSLA